MRPMTETRTRRLSDPQLLANKRLSNGFNKTDHVTTRSQAKTDPSPRVSPARKVKQKFLTTEERRLMISMRLRHEEKHTSQANLKLNQEQADVGRKGRSRFHSTNGKKNGISYPMKSLRTRAKVLTCVNDREIGDTIMHQTLKKRAREMRNRENRAKKRRSALWVLNCEAEEFLFGETAAEGQEVELPPISPPPRKRRRTVRATELGDLLKETPLLESKLRYSVSSTVTSESDTSESSEASSTNQHWAQKGRRNRTQKLPNRVPRKLELESPVSDMEDDCSSNSEFLNLNYTLMLEAAAAAAAARSSAFSPASATEQSVRIKRILSSIEYSFSFENVPSSEVWYRTFSHQNRPRHIFQMPTESSVILPYEAKGLNRDLAKKLRRPPRKSPRCHASTQAILSALKRTPRGGRVAIPASPSPSSSSKSKLSHIVETSVPSSSSSYPSVGSQPLCSTLPLIPSLVAPNAIQTGIKSCEMTATQYLWDSIQFLSDPYVIHVLNLADPRTPKCVPRSIPFSIKDPTIGKVYTNHNNNVKMPLKVVIPSPKTSPSVQRFLSTSSPSSSHSASQNGYGSKDMPRVLRSPTSTSAMSPVSMPSPPLSRAMTSPSDLRGIARKSTRKGLLVSVDPSTTHLNKHGPYGILKFKTASKFSSFPVAPPPAEEVLFATGTFLPDFPWETFT